MAGTLSQLGLGGGTGPVAAIVNGSGAATTVIIAAATAATSANALVLASGALTAGVLKKVLDVSGRGRLGFASVHHISEVGTARTIRLKVTVDGAVIFDRTANGIGGQAAGLVGIGTLDGGLQWVEYRQSALIEIASSLTETDKLQAAYLQEVWQ